METPLIYENAQEMYETAPCGYISTLADGTIVRVNQTLLDWTGYAREDLVSSKRLQDLLTVERSSTKLNFSCCCKCKDALKRLHWILFAQIALPCPFW